MHEPNELERHLHDIVAHNYANDPHCGCTDSGWNFWLACKIVTAGVVVFGGVWWLLDWLFGA